MPEAAVELETVVGALAGRAVATSGVAHSEQNFAAGSFAVPHFGQTTANGVAHSVQNFAPGRFSVPQLLQITRGG